MPEDLPFSILEIRLPKSCEKTPEAAAQLFTSFSNLPKKTIFSFKPPVSLAFEIACVDQVIHFLIVCPKSMQAYVESQVTAQYPECVLTPLPKDYLKNFLSQFKPFLGQMVLANKFYLPLKTFRDLKDADPISGVLGMMSKAGPNDFLAIQILISRADGWQNFAQGLIDKGIPGPEGRSLPHPQTKQITQKIGSGGFWTGIKMVANSEANLNTLASAFSAYQSESNRFKLKKPLAFRQKKFLKAFLNRSFEMVPGNQVLNLDELASIWHPAAKALAGIKNIAWTQEAMSEPPQNLPISTDSEEEKKEINFFARAEYKNKVTTFGIKKKDRRRHVYVIGKSGTGKSTLIANMAINDLRNREGLAVVDPHGDLTEILLDYIPSYRINETCYLDPSDTDHPFHLNPLEVKNPAHKELVASNIVAIFYKLYSYSWGPRLEYILRNTILTLLETKEPTLVQVIDLLTNNNFRKKVVDNLDNTVLKSFWVNEFEKMDPKIKSEAISPILNKVGQFTSSPTIRQIIGTYHSTINLEEIMNEGKVLLVNLSQGKIGEDNAALLGAMIITQLQLAAMNRIRVAEEERRDFYLYVDEFQNFATSAFIKILSEARKYRLCLCLANQYVGQLGEDLQKAIFGNAGTLISFVVGSQDAGLMAKEFAQVYKEENMVSLGMFQIALKLCIDNLTSTPFLATTLPPPRCINKNREKVLRVSMEKFTVKRK
ncbi:MAG: type IV secretion system DNA-binding domain-containing protein [Patescibacteria group bacterium]|nr:type IV secretion system DNA-binding domain-containing protein [Patescibacteria group bacterium]